MLVLRSLLWAIDSRVVATKMPLTTLTAVSSSAISRTSIMLEIALSNILRLVTALFSQRIFRLRLTKLALTTRSLTSLSICMRCRRFCKSPMIALTPCLRRKRTSWFIVLMAGTERRKCVLSSS
jgi:hypothetical protein